MTPRSKRAPRPTRKATQSPERWLEDVLVKAMTSPDPALVIRRARSDKRLPSSLHNALAAIHEDGLRLTALLVVRLRFERLVQGSVEASAWFERDPEGFAAVFRRYHREVPPTAHFPPQEAQLFHAWDRRRRIDG